LGACCGRYRAPSIPLRLTLDRDAGIAARNAAKMRFFRYFPADQGVRAEVTVNRRFRSSWAAGPSSIA
jgi:hypothetical protein